MNSPKNGDGRAEPASPAKRQGPTHHEVALRLLGYLKPFLPQLLLGLLCGTLVGIAQLGIADRIERFINGLTAANAPQLAWVCATVVCLYAILGLAKYGQSVLVESVAQRVGLALRRDVYAHLQTLSLAYFKRRRTGALMSTLTADIPKLQNAAMMIKDVVATPVQAAIFFGTMFYLSWKLTFSALFIVPIMAAIIQRLTRRLRNTSRETQDRLADVAAVMEETLSAPRIVRAFTAERHEVARFEEESERAVRSQLKVVRRSARLGPVVDLIGAVGVAGVLYIGGTEVLNGTMTAGGLIKYLYLVSQLMNAVSSMGSLRSGVEEMMGAADRIFQDVLDVTPDIRDAPDAKPLPPVEGRIEFRDVSFAYEPGIPVLANISLTIEPGQVVALVGETGAGKTTLADLVPRFYDPTEGAVLIDGHDIGTVRLESLRSQIGIVPQETLLFSGTIRDNITYGRRDALDVVVEAAARAANAAPFVSAMPNGYDTWIGERGATLSGGQRQRVAIARALLADPRILILDEATSALDAATEALVQQALERLMEGRTTLIIAHRLSTVVNADKIVVLRRGGRIAETGTHAELMARGGVYAALFETQQRSAELNPALVES
jgi:subfamily B ATP-binding cassette protein MsbA